VSFLFLFFFPGEFSEFFSIRFFSTEKLTFLPFLFFHF